MKDLSSKLLTYTLFIKYRLGEKKVFHYFNGILTYCALNTAVIECSGVGYKLTVSAMTLAKIAGKENSSVKLYSYLAVREDAVELFGFATEDELEAYKLLIGVSGIGPKAAIAILSIFTPEKLAATIASGDAKSISRAQGIGAKTAARVILELKDKFNFFGEASGDGSESSAGSLDASVGGLSEAGEVLAVLGYTRAEIASAMKGIDTSLDSEEIVKLALKKLASGK